MGFSPISCTLALRERAAKIRMSLGTPHQEAQKSGTRCLAYQKFQGPCVLKMDRGFFVMENDILAHRKWFGPVFFRFGPGFSGLAPFFPGLAPILLVRIDGPVARKTTHEMPISRTKSSSDSDNLEPGLPERGKVGPRYPWTQKVGARSP